MKTPFRLILGSASALLLATAEVRAHCDTLEGPVVSAARAALSKGEVSPVLMWVGPRDEPEIRSAFDRALVVRKQSPAAAQLADTWFFETLVRVHRAGEGAPYSGLQPEAKAEPGIAAADRALTAGNADALVADTTRSLETALKQRFERVKDLKAQANDNVEAGRAYVAAYVDYVHFVERAAKLTTHGADREGIEGLRD